MKEVIRYKCDFCKKTYANKSSCRYHEKRCWCNPERRACLSCKKYNDDEYMITNEYLIDNRYVYKCKYSENDFSYNCKYWEAK